ncbi:hypothetical protein MUY_003583 [Bacillus licheniformis WX-02]|nr:hypothetical protein MUY_003583 [Bacillus licheniformis WX-02]
MISYFKNSDHNNQKINICFSYPERWREVPYETRQPSTRVEMVPIHAKRYALKDERKAQTFPKPFCSCVQKGFFR